MRAHIVYSFAGSMPWKTCNVMESREAFVLDHSRGGLSFSELCRRHGISRASGYKWIGRHRAEGEKGLLDRSRRPASSPGKSSPELEAMVVSIRREHPVWGGRKIRRILQDRGCPGPVPAASTISSILRRHGLLGRGTREGSGPTERFERGEPNDLWQMDFKGWIRLDDGKRCHPLTILDDHSRYSISLEACAAETEPTVRPLLKKAFRRYGLPRQILCDHGNPWGKGLGPDGRQQGTPRLEVWLARLGVEVIHGRVRHPQTQGKEERFHRTLKAEVLDRESLWLDHAHCQREFGKWRRLYNCERPHEALDLETPSSRYRPSTRSYPETLAPEESFYLDDDVVRRVKSKGEITFSNRFHYIGSAYAGAPVALRRRGSGVWEVYYCWKKLGIIDLKTTPKKKGRYHSIRAKL